MIGLVGCIIVSAGVAVQAGRLGRRLPSTARLGSALLALAAIVVVAFVGGQALGGSAGRAAAGVASPSSAAPNILVVVLDTVRADRLSIHGYPAQTPTLDRLASEGTMFEWAISTSSWTLPAHASLLTGLAPEGHKGTTVDSVLSPAFDRLSQRFEGVGYRTGAFIANNIFVIPEHGFAPGFQVFDAHYVRSLAARTTWGRAAKAVGRRYLNRELDPFRPAETINAAFAAWRAQAALAGDDPAGLQEIIGDEVLELQTEQKP